VQAALGQPEQPPTGQIDEDRGLHQTSPGVGRVADVVEIEVQHGNSGDGEDQTQRQAAQPARRRQKPHGAGHATEERHAEAGQRDFQALRVKTHINHVAEDMPEHDRETHAVQGFQPDRRDQLRAGELPLWLDEKQHQQRDGKCRQQQLADDGDQVQSGAEAAGQRKQAEHRRPERDDHHERVSCWLFAASSC
jgi:hypothetical protein